MSKAELIKRVLNRPHTFKAHVYRQIVPMKKDTTITADIRDKDLQLFRVYLNKFQTEIGGKFYTRVKDGELYITRYA